MHSCPILLNTPWTILVATQLGKEENVKWPLNSEFPDQSCCSNRNKEHGRNPNRRRRTEFSVLIQRITMS